MRVAVPRDRLQGARSKGDGSRQARASRLQTLGRHDGRLIMFLQQPWTRANGSPRDGRGLPMPHARDVMAITFCALVSSNFQ